MRDDVPSLLEAIKGVCVDAAAAIREQYGGDAARGWQETDHVEWMLWVLVQVDYFRREGRTSQEGIEEFVSEVVTSDYWLYTVHWIDIEACDKIREYIPEWPI